MKRGKEVGRLTVRIYVSTKYWLIPIRGVANLLLVDNICSVGRSSTVFGDDTKHLGTSYRNR
jgi:hypothetical protein